QIYYDVIMRERKGEYLGKGKQVDVHLGTFDAPLFAVMNTKAKSMELEFDGETATAKLEVSGGKPGERVLRFDLLNSRRRRLLDRGANVLTRKGAASWTPEGRLPKNGTLVCRDVATGVGAEVQL
ncbi:MAG: hypothetical protein ACOC8E_05365, partial [Planctomycetota bacterium]